MSEKEEEGMAAAMMAFALDRGRPELEAAVLALTERSLDGEPKEWVPESAGEVLEESAGGGAGFEAFTFAAEYEPLPDGLDSLGAAIAEEFRRRQEKPGRVALGGYQRKRSEGWMTQWPERQTEPYAPAYTPPANPANVGPAPVIVCGLDANATPEQIERALRAARRGR